MTSQHDRPNNNITVDGLFGKIKSLTIRNTIMKKNNPRQIQDVNVARYNHKIPDEN